MPGIKFDWNGQDMERKLAAAQTKAFFYLSKTTAYYSLRAEGQAKKGAPWTDRTGNARSGLVGTYAAERGASGGSFEINLSHSVDYGIFLETRTFPKAGKLAIIAPTLFGQQSVEQQYMNAVQKVLDRMFS